MTIKTALIIFLDNMPVNYRKINNRLKFVIEDSEYRTLILHFLIYSRVRKQRKVILTTQFI